MDNYIVGVHKAVEVARKLRNGGAKIKRVQKGKWEVTFSPAFMSRPQKGDMLLISRFHTGNDVYIVPEPEWMFKRQVENGPDDIVWQYIRFHGNTWSDDDKSSWLYPTIS